MRHSSLELSVPYEMEGKINGMESEKSYLNISVSLSIRLCFVENGEEKKTLLVSARIVDRSSSPGVAEQNFESGAFLATLERTGSLKNP